MKPTHRYDTKAYHDYCIHQAGKGYPVFAGRRYQRGHGLGSIFGGLFKAAVPLLKKGAKTLEREALKTVLNITWKKYQTGSKITIEINRRKLTPESNGHGRTPG
jgi:DnaJ-class molecular chaperone